MFHDPLIRVFPVSATALIIQTITLNSLNIPQSPGIVVKWCWLAHQPSDLQRSDSECRHTKDFSICLPLWEIISLEP